MNASSFKYGVLTLTLSLVSIILALVPFHAFLTVWGASLVGHYTALRLWKEALMALGALGVLYLYIFDRKVRAHTSRRKLSWLILSFVVVQLIWTAAALQAGSVNQKAAAYGLLLNCRFLLFFMLAWLVAIRTDRLEQRWPKLLLWPAIIVVIFGLLQVFVLPPDFLRHFGYSAATIAPVATINHNQAYLRYFSTLRGANPLGAYLLLPISALTVLLVRFPRSWNWTKALLLAGSLMMLLFSFSRSAWLGAAISVAVVLLLSTPRRLYRHYRWWLTAAGGLVLLTAVIGLLALHNNVTFQNAFLHTQTNSSIKATSNEGHLQALKSSLSDVAHQPLGRGPGSAGPASVYNNHPTRIAENYYLQIGQETGLPGLALFAAISVTIGYILWTRRSAPLALTLLAALIGISFINLLSHAWTDDTLAYLWWGLAGISIGTPLTAKDKRAAQ